MLDKIWRASELWQKRDVGGYDSPAFGQANPDLTLASVDCLSVFAGAFEFECDAAVVGAEGDDVQAFDGAGKADRGAGLAEGFKLFEAVEVFRDSEAHDFGRVPKHCGEGFDVIGDERGFVVGVEGGELGDGGGVVDGHDLEEPPFGQDVLGDGGGDGDHGAVDDLGEAKIHGDGAEQVGFERREAPVGGEEIDHAGGCGAGGFERGVGAARGFDNGPKTLRRGRGWRGVDDWGGEGAGFVEMEAEGGVGGHLDAVDADFAIALGGVGVAA